MIVESRKEILSESLVEGVLPVSQNPYPIYEQNLQPRLQAYSIDDLTKNSIPYLPVP